MNKPFFCFTVLILSLLSASLLSACYPIENKRANTDSLEGLKQHSFSPYHRKSGKSGETNRFRSMAMQEHALGIGAQSGLAWRAKQINASLKQESKKLDLVYNFNPLLMPHNVLPPVLVQADHTLNLDSPTTLHIADRTYKIEKAARFVTTVPNWQEYLWLNYTKPDKPAEGFLPKNQAEQVIWDDAVTRGWHQGIQQANSMFNDGLARLTRDFNGIVLYRKLLAQRVVTAPFVDQEQLGVTGDDQSIDINNQVLRITAPSALNPNTQTWRPALIPKQDQIDPNTGLPKPQKPMSIK